VLLNPEVATMPTDLTLDEFMAQMNQVKRLGPSASLLKLIPGMRDMLEQAQLGESEIELALGRMRAMYDAMTLAERQAPSDIDPAARRRTAEKAGVDVTDVSRFIRDFEQSRDMMRSIGRTGAASERRPASVLGLVTNDPSRRDPSFVHSTPPRWQIGEWLLAALIAAALLALAWGQFGHGLGR
jgi:signal recognition particle GTPase